MIHPRSEKIKAGIKRRPDVASVARLVRNDPESARALLRGLSVEEQAEACLRVRPAERAELLMLLDEPESVIPRLPETDFLVTVRAGDVAGSGWLLASSTEEQRTAAIDIDCWQYDELRFDRLREWIDGLIDAGPETLAMALDELDPEVWILALRDMGAGTREPGEDGDEKRVRELLTVARAERPRMHMLLVYGVRYEDPYEIEEYARRWRVGRMADLGFPDRDQAMRAYRPLQAAEVERIDWVRSASVRGVVDGGVHLPVSAESTLVAEALRGLSPAVAVDVLGYVLAVANTVAVADRVDLSDPDAIARSLEKALAGVEAGLREVTRVLMRPPREILSTSRPLDLFRVAVALDPKLRPPRGKTSVATEALSLDHFEEECSDLFGEDLFSEEFESGRRDEGATGERRSR